jgi:hypothetical protein
MPQYDIGLFKKKSNIFDIFPHKLEIFKTSQLTHPLSNLLERDYLKLNCITL